MIYLVSDDNYFKLGVEVIIGSIKKSVVIINVNDEFITPELTYNDTLIICVENIKIITKFITTTRCCRVNTLLVMDNASKKTMMRINTWSQNVISKKMKKEDFSRFLDTGFSNMRTPSFLTDREICIMHALSKEKTHYSISKSLNISMKTVSGHKANALRKLGLGHLNVRSILIFEAIFHCFM